MILPTARCSHLPAWQSKKALDNSLAALGTAPENGVDLHPSCRFSMSFFRMKLSHRSFLCHPSDSTNHDRTQADSCRGSLWLEREQMCTCTLTVTNSTMDLCALHPGGIQYCIIARSAMAVTKSSSHTDVS